MGTDGREEGREAWQSQQFDSTATDDDDDALGPPREGEKRAAATEKQPTGTTRKHLLAETT